VDLVVVSVSARRAGPAKRIPGKSEPRRGAGSQASPPGIISPRQTPHDKNPRCPGPDERSGAYRGRQATGDGTPPRDSGFPAPQALPFNLRESRDDRSATCPICPSLRCRPTAGPARRQHSGNSPSAGDGTFPLSCLAPGCPAEVKRQAGRCHDSIISARGSPTAPRARNHQLNSPTAPIRRLCSTSAWAHDPGRNRRSRNARSGTSGPRSAKSRLRRRRPVRSRRRCRPSAVASCPRRRSRR
jgi:hypothetical protein